MTQNPSSANPAVHAIRVGGYAATLICMFASAAAYGQQGTKSSSAAPPRLNLPAIDLPEEMPSLEDLGLEESLTMEGSTHRAVVDGDAPPNADRTKPSDVEETIKSIQDQRRRRIERLNRQLKLFDRVLDSRTTAPIPNRPKAPVTPIDDHGTPAPSPVASNGGNAPAVAGGAAMPETSAHAGHDAASEDAYTHGKDLLESALARMNSGEANEQLASAGPKTKPNSQVSTGHAAVKPEHGDAMHGDISHGDQHEQSTPARKDEWSELTEQIKHTPFGEASSDRPALADNLFSLEMFPEALSIYEALFKKAKLNDPQRTWYAYQIAITKRRMGDWEGAIRGWREVVITHQRGILTDVSKWWLDRAAAMQSVAAQSANFRERLEAYESELADETVK